MYLTFKRTINNIILKLLYKKKKKLQICMHYILSLTLFSSLLHDIQKNYTRDIMIINRVGLVRSIIKTRGDEGV